MAVPVNPTRADIANTRFTLPPDAKLLSVSELSGRLRARIGPVEDDQSVVTRPGFRVTTRLVPKPLANLLAEFRAPKLLTEAVLRFARRHGHDPLDTLDLAFDALATLVESRILVPADSPDASSPEPTLAAGQEFAGYEVHMLVRSLEDSEVYRASGRGGELAALKISRDRRPGVVAMLAHEARVLDRLAGADSPRLLEYRITRGRACLAMEWCEGVSIAVAAQQARAARDRRRLHSLVGRMLTAYGRLHQRGVLHGDIHPGNCLVDDAGRVVILDFGSARMIDPSARFDPIRSGIPHFYDPQMAGALLAGQLPPATTPASEQYAIAVLAYLLLTGLHPIEMPAVQQDLLRRIVERPMLPFAARGVSTWPAVESVVARGLAKKPGDRFPDVSALAHAFWSAGPPNNQVERGPAAAERAFTATVEAIRVLAPSAGSLAHAWFALRAALALEDAELLAAADILVRGVGSGWADHTIAALVARARSDARLEGQAIARFLDSVRALPDRPEAGAAIIAAASLVEGTPSRSVDADSLAAWGGQQLDHLALASSSAEGRARINESLLVYAALSLNKTGAVSARELLAQRLHALGDIQAGSVWLWALAHDVFSDDRFRELALAAKLPSRPLDRGLALLRLHQLTGDDKWVALAGRLVARAPTLRLPALDTALLLAELRAPERVVLPPFLIPFAVCGGRKRGCGYIQSADRHFSRRQPSQDG
jgi:serine/threonine-protein kinase